MSGTSLDGVDAVLTDFAAIDRGSVRVLAHAHHPFEPAFAEQLLALNASGANELHRAALAANALARVYARGVSALLDTSGVAPAAVAAIGAHGQTVRHCPREFDATGYTLQLNSPALLAELTGIDVIADFRSRDVAAGGQGAPLVPAFHRAVFGRPDATVVVLNLGGIGNLTVLRADGRTTGFDCGPANALLDHWSLTHTGRAFDEGGTWAASGRVIEPLLRAMLAEPYFGLPPPKSTGRDLFRPEWLARHSLLVAPTARAADVQATLAELTATVCANDVRQYAARARTLLVCGGGALNRDLMQRLARLLPQVRIEPTDAQGLPATQVEACAFAWLARAFMRRECASLASVTGATGARVLGALYPAR
ncbi:MAG TPA: anhydro-N-acetylmuramic acid kinase [Burkholderiaceae bacterium]|nr:anhydro-N-acetylmuramic acid kinase [Burkholderiaceae bacterium]